MDFEPTPDEQAVRDAARRLSTVALPALPAEATAFVTSAHAELARSGLLEAKTLVAAALAVSELSVGSASLGAVLASAWLATDTVGRAARSNAGLASVADAARRGERILALAMSDRRAAGDGTVLSFAAVPCAAVATHLVVGAGVEGGATVAVVDPAAAGIERTAPGPGFGLERTASADVVIPPAALRAGALVAEGEPGQAALEALLAARRILVGAIAVGLGKRVAARAVARTRGAPVRPTQLTDFALSDVATELDAAAVAVFNAAWLRDSGAPHRVESAGARLFAARAATKMAHAAIEVCGGADPDGALRRAYVDARSIELFDGSLGPQVDIIASTLLEER